MSGIANAADLCESSSRPCDDEKYEHYCCFVLDDEVICNGQCCLVLDDEVTCALVGLYMYMCASDSKLGDMVINKFNGR